jgi:coenzyme F420-0:L-glutamate ligase/coenzyme F420-1:gamma-L-glutamate ligase
MKIEMFGLQLGEIKMGDDIATLIVKKAQQNSDGIQEGDIIVITSKIVSKAYGLLIELAKVKPSKKASHIAKITGTDSRFVQVVLDNSDDILFTVPVYKLAREVGTLEKLSTNQERAWEALKKTPCELITVRGNRLCGNAGLDMSNHPEGIVSVPPKNGDEIAQKLRREILKLTGHDIAVIITDTEWISRLGTLDVAIGVSGIQVNARKLGDLDLYDKPKYGGMDSIVDEISCAAVLLMGQTTEGIPVVVMRGYKYQKSEESISDYLFDLKVARKVTSAIISHSLRALRLTWLFRLVIR